MVSLKHNDFSLLKSYPEIGKDIYNQLVCSGMTHIELLLVFKGFLKYYSQIQHYEDTFLE